MRLLGRLLLALVLLPPAVWLGLGAVEATNGWLGRQARALPPPKITKGEPLEGDAGGGQPAAAPDVDVSIVYTLDPVTWTTFPFSASQRSVRLVTHADVPTSAVADPAAPWRYAVAYRLLGAGGAVLTEGVFHLATKAIAYRDVGTGEIKPGASYAGDDLAPTASDVTVLDLEHLPGGATELQARVAEAEPPIRRVNLRVYEQEPVQSRRLTALWGRMSNAQRRRLAAATLYPPELLTGDERANLLRNRWHPVGPSGVLGRDYVARELRVLEQPPGERVEPPEPPAGLYVDADHRGMVPLPPEGGRVRLDFAPAAPEAQEAPVEVVLNWYGEHPGQQSATTVSLSPPEMDHVASFGTGLVEIVAPVPLAVRAWLEDAGAAAAPREITPEPAKLRAYLATGAAAVTYPVHHVGDEPTPLRVDVRCLACPGPGEPASNEPSRLAYEFLDARQHRIAQGEWEPVLSPSMYDRPADVDAGSVTDPASAYFSVPPGVASVRLTASRPLLVAAYTRPPDVPRLVRVPENREDAPDEVELRTWFSVRPASWDLLQAQQRSAVLDVQPRPPKPPQAEILQGLYEWEQFVPEGSWLARELLVPRGDLPIRARALGVAYTPVPTDRSVALRFGGQDVDGSVTPRLAFLRPRRGPMQLTFFADGRELFSGAVAAARGEVELPPLVAGRHEVRVSSSEPAEVLVNCVEAGADALIRRRAIRVAPGETEFEIVKGSPERELLVAHAFLAAEAAGRQEMTVTIRGGGERAAGPHPEWTVRRHRFSLRAGPEAPTIPVLGSQDLVGAERTLFIPLGRDLPPGTYGLTLSLDGRTEAYLSLTRTTSGLAERRQIGTASACQGGADGP